MDLCPSLSLSSCPPSLPLPLNFQSISLGYLVKFHTENAYKLSRLKLPDTVVPYTFMSNQPLLYTS